MITKEYLQQELVKRIDGYKRGVETSTDNIVAEMKSILVLVNALPNYEKKYNEALARAKDVMNGPSPHDSSVATVEYIFPELRESEDERIRKWLVDYFGSIKEVVWIHRDITCEQIIEWLEKQKEYHIPWYDYQKSKEAGYTIVPNEEYEQLIKQKEQKPAWSEEDEKMRTNAVLSLQYLIEEFPNAEFIDSVKKEKAWLKSLRPSWKPSEEQMDALKELIDDANRAGWVTPGATELYEQLKKL